MPLFITVFDMSVETRLVRSYIGSVRLPLVELLCTPMYSKWMIHKLRYMVSTILTIEVMLYPEYD